ncbi:MAG: type VI secretion system ATPase TssH [Verrucomicrobiales bacterium]|nr:type VI secretion system ATPase TssH [Verrucomicrobiales bacterium]
MVIDLKALIGKLNPVCRQALEAAAGLCVSQTNYNVEIEHLLLKLLDKTDSDLSCVLREKEVDTNNVVSTLTRAVDQFQRGNARTPAFSPLLVSFLREGWLYSSLQLGSPLVRSGGLLLALIGHEAFQGILHSSTPLLKALPVEEVTSQIRSLVESSAEQSAARHPPHDGTEGGSPTSTAGPSRFPALDQYTVDLTARARAGLIDPIYGRDGEIRQIIDILSRRRQNNPILTGEAGVGKTAVVEGFAAKVVAGDVPPSLRGIAVRTLDVGLLEAGAGVKGEFENRLKSLIREVAVCPQPVILFIDEAHTLIGAGGQAGMGDAANLLKPALARGELRTIAATTWSEYKRSFEKDPALARRFQVVKIGEPDEKAAIDMLRAAAARLESHHQVRILDAAVRDAVKLSQRYLTGRQLPDKAISVLDTACARVAIAQNSIPSSLEDVMRRRQLIELELQVLKREQAIGIIHRSQIEALEIERQCALELQEDLEARWSLEKDMVAKIRQRQEQITAADASRAAEDTQRLTDELHQWEAQLRTLQGEEPMVTPAVEPGIIASVISGWTGIPAGKMLANAIDTVLTLEARLAERIVGQPQALDALCRRIKTTSAHLDDPQKPIGVFLLVGPSGVGKTETALSLAELLFGGERKLVVVNMSEYQEAHTVSALKGAPPGYIGHGKGGVLTEAVRRNPYCVLLLDEVEKAHPDVLELFYQVFDKGTLEDSEGVVVDFKHCLILLTSNVGSGLLMRAAADPAAFPESGRAAVDRWVQPGEPSRAPRLDMPRLSALLRLELLKHFKPAFLGRLVLVPYQPLERSHLQAIVRLKLDRIQRRLREQQQAHLSYAPELVAAVVARCTEPESGARNIDHILTQTLLPELSAEILKRMAQQRPFISVHLGLRDDGAFAYTFHDR